VTPGDRAGALQLDKQGAFAVGGNDPDGAANARRPS
jgi:hypothetical protein